MGGRLSKPRSTDAWGPRVRDLAEQLGFGVRELWRYFDEFALIAEYELRIPRAAAEDSAWRLLRGCFDKLAVANETDGWAQ